jgi:deferrochelatase/peroxidase EfeB
VTLKLELSDIQGNIVRSYGRHSFPIARHFFLHICTVEGGRRFVEWVRHRVTTAEPWPSSVAYPQSDTAETKRLAKRPDVAMNVGFSFRGLLALGIDTRTLARLPPEFIDGMAARAHILGDVDQSAPDQWDPIWRRSLEDQQSAEDRKNIVHVCLSMHGQLDKLDELEQQTQELRRVVAEDLAGEVILLSGHGRDGGADFQSASTIMVNGLPTAKEHFGYTDGIGDAVFMGQSEPGEEKERVIGRGKLRAISDPDKRWAPIATGEFILGYPDEAQELPLASPPWEFTRNGTFMVYRKLHQNVASYHGYIERVADQYAQVVGLQDRVEAVETVRAKLVGRWTDGVPLSKAPTYAEHIAFNQRYSDVLAWIRKYYIEGDKNAQIDRARWVQYNRDLIDFDYSDDHQGLKCPVGTHLRRVNTRDMLDPRSEKTSVLNNRRRILRRGLPYGTVDHDNLTDDGEHGVVFMAICASLFRQFEFIQQQWVQYGLDFNLGNDTDPIIGRHDSGAKFIIAADPQSGSPPFICTEMPQFVTTRGGEYFFLPSLTAMRMMATGNVDPS